MPHTATSNRTKVELKQISRELKELTKDFQSNQSGIETIKNKILWSWVFASNRTKVELKRGLFGNPKNPDELPIEPKWN